MNENENKYSWFEQELRKSVNDSHTDYAGVESKLFSRITAADDLKELGILKLDSIPSADLFDKVEQGLFSQIIQHKEYEEPVNECIGFECDLTFSQWERLSLKLEERIHDSASCPLWEQLLMAPEKEPTWAEWEALEENLFARIDVMSKTELWEQCTHLDEVNLNEALDAAEKKLDARIKEKQSLQNWEQILQTEEIRPYSRWEICEEKLFCRIQSDQKITEIAKQPFWYIVDHYLSITKTLRVISVAFFLTLITVGALLLQEKFSEKVPTLVYQLQGKAVMVSNLLNGIIDQNCSSVSGGAISLVNSHGLVELQNGSEIEIQRLSKQHALYRVGFEEPNSAVDIGRGKVSFLVNPHHGKESFRVLTPDYQIIVTGTYFRVEPDLGGKFSTRVLEGEVKVESRLFKDTVIRAGQSLVYDLMTKEYRLQNGGAVVLRKEIEAVPDVEDLMRYKVVSIKTSVPDADIRIDGKYYGAAPLAIRQPIGPHHVWIGKDGYSSIDTLLTLSENDTGITLSVALNMIILPSKTDSTAKEKKEGIRAPQPKSPPISPEMVAQRLLGKEAGKKTVADSIYNQAQKAESGGNWKNAISLYQEVFDDPDVSRLRREDALFSIGKLRADNEAGKNDARQVFLTYLALYPGGAFAGETWLRLAELEFKVNPENAVQYYLKYFEMFPRHPRISELQNRVGIIYLQQRKYDDAIAMFRQALSNLISPTKDERRNIVINLQRALEAKGDSRSADSILRQYTVSSADRK